MKRHGFIYDKIISLENLRKADVIAQKGKQKQPGVIIHNKNREANIQALHKMLVDKKFKTSEYSTFPVYEPKERLVYSLPFFPDRILHHAIMLQLDPILNPTFTSDTYSCIKGRGIHKAIEAVKKSMINVNDTFYCLQMDITKFYPSTDHDILKGKLRRKIKDNDVLNLLDEIIDSAEGLPIGNLLSQSFSTFYLTYFDHWIKETLKVKDYFRYADDMIIFASNKPQLHAYLAAIRKYLKIHLKLDLKGNYQVFPVHSRGVNFLGYIRYHTHTRLRKPIKKGYAKAVIFGKSKASIASYRGWAKHANTINLTNKLNHARIQRLQHRARKKDIPRYQSNS